MVKGEQKVLWRDESEHRLFMKLRSAPRERRGGGSERSVNRVEGVDVSNVFWGLWS